MDEYTVVTTNVSLKSLIKKVNELIGDGWKVHAGVAAVKTQDGDESVTRYYQPMIKKEGASK